MIETLEKRNMARADSVLSNWRKLAFQKRICKLNLHQKTYVFTVQRVLKKFRRNQERKLEAKKIDLKCTKHHKTYTKMMVFNALLERHRSKKVVNIRKANHFRR
jgi:hypothetical protein